MSNHNHEGKIWSNATPSVNRHSGPGTDFGVIDFVDTGADITQQLGEQGSCDLLQQRLANSFVSNQPIG